MAKYKSYVSVDIKELIDYSDFTAEELKTPATEKNVTSFITTTYACSLKTKEQTLGIPDKHLTTLKDDAIVRNLTRALLHTLKKVSRDRDSFFEQVVTACCMLVKQAAFMEGRELPTDREIFQQIAKPTHELLNALLPAGPAATHAPKDLKSQYLKLTDEDLIALTKGRDIN